MSSVSTEKTAFGTVLYSFEYGRKASNARKRAVEAVGASSAAILPTGLWILEGTLGVAVAAAGLLTLITAYMVSFKTHTRSKQTKVDIYERGIVCSQRNTTRELFWNEVVDISCIPKRPQNDTDSIAIVFENAASRPLTVSLGGEYCPQQLADELLKELRHQWLSVWCRRANVLAQYGLLQVGKATVKCSGILINDREIPWKSITGASAEHGIDHLTTEASSENVETNTNTKMFPSAAERIAAMAEHPPEALNHQPLVRSAVHR